MSKPLLKKFNDMKQRCLNPNNKSFKDYGGRGISICEDWLNNPQSFVSYVLTHLGECPDGHSLDRIDNEGHYEPGNIQWADAHQQNTNKRNNVPHNTRVGNTGFKWVNKRPTGYVGQYTYNQVKHYVGHYSTPEEAYQAVVAHRKSRGFPV